MINSTQYEKIEECIRFISHVFQAEHSSTKPILLHSLQVGLKLIELEKDVETCLAGFLHDILEDSSVKPSIVEQRFGITVLNLVLANSKNPQLKKFDEIYHDLFSRCINNGIEACQIKAVDIYTNIQYYSKINNSKRLTKLYKMRDLYISITPKKFRDNATELLITLEPHTKNSKASNQKIS